MTNKEQDQQTLARVFGFSTGITVLACIVMGVVIAMVV